MLCITRRVCKKFGMGGQGECVRKAVKGEPAVSEVLKVPEIASYKALRKPKTLLHEVSSFIVPSL